MKFGAPHRHYRVTDSTNDRARDLVEAGAPGGTVITSREQTEGRGRQGRVWTAPEGKALLYSAILRPLDERHLLLPLSVPLAVCTAAEELRPGAECQVKWPNDVWLEGRKLSGILIEAKPQESWAVIGVGLNLSIAPDEFPPDLRHPAISLFSSRAEDRGRGSDGRSPLLSVGSPPPIPSTAAAPPDLSPTPFNTAQVMSRHLGKWVEASDEEVLAEWRRRDGLLGHEIFWDEGKSSGVADGIDGRGNLVVALAAGGSVTLGSGEVQIRL